MPILNQLHCVICSAPALERIATARAAGTGAVFQTVNTASCLKQFQTVFKAKAFETYLFTYGVRPSSAQSFGDQLGRVRGTKSKIEDGYYTGTTCAGVVAVGDLAGAQPLPVQVVLELSHFLLLSAAVGASLEAMQR